jgi:hypothetical protein
VFEASLARRTPGDSADLLDKLPGASAGLPCLERQFLDAWLEGLLAFRTYQRMAQACERRLLVCCPPDAGRRTWALTFAIGLVGSGLRPALLTARTAAELMDAALRTASAAIVLGWTGRDWPGLEPAMLPVAVFLEGARDGFLPLGDDLGDARQRVIAYLGTGGDQP